MSVTEDKRAEVYHVCLYVKSDLTVSTNKKKTRNRRTVVLSETSQIVVMFVATLTLTLTLTPTRTLLHNLQCVLSCHHNIFVTLLALQVLLIDISGVRSAGFLPRQTRVWAGRYVASQAVRIFQKVGLQAQAKRRKGKQLYLLYILLYVTMREKEIKK